MAGKAFENPQRKASPALKSDGREIGWDLIHAASASTARYAIYPLQDVLGLGPDARMNYLKVNAAVRQPP